MRQSDDLTGSYLEYREQSELTPAQKRRMQTNPTGGRQGKPFEFAPIAKDIGRGVVESPRQTVKGFIEAGIEAGNMAYSAFDALDIPTVLQYKNEQGEFDLDLITKKEFEERGGKTIAETVGEAIPEAESATGGGINDFAQFLAGFIPSMRGTKAMGLGKMLQAPVAGAIADFSVFDPHEERLANLIQKYPDLQNPVTEFLAADENDSEFEGRLKAAVEGAGLGVLTDSLLFGLKGLRNIRKARAEQATIDADKETIEGLASRAKRAKKEAAEEKGVALFGKERVDEPRFTKADDSDALNINRDRLDTSEDVKDLIDGVAEKFAPTINKARREKITLEQQEALANDLGMSVEDLLARQKGDAFNAEQAIAARKILVSSGEELIDLAKKAEAGADVDLIAFRRAMAQHHAIQQQVSGMTAEAGRALGSFRVMANSAKEQQQILADLVEVSGGSSTTKEMAKMISSLETPKQINLFVRKSAGAKTKEALMEVWINGLLSAVDTHMVNASGNSLNVFTSVLERKVASSFGIALGDEAIPSGEATAMMYGMVKGARDGLKLAWNTIKTGEPSDQLNKVEVSTRKAITGENLGLSGMPGRFADYLGNFVRLPGTMLAGGDEFFKAVNSRMELHAQAFRQATSEGLEGDALLRRVNDIIDNPPENIKMHTADYARYQTFTRPLGVHGKKIQALQKVPPMNVLMPFVRTPVNIMKYVGERTPLAPVHPAIRAEIAAGGARRDLALAKIATGSTIMLAAADMTLSGEITGAGPVDPTTKKMLRNTGWQPYSIRVGDTYYSYSRLDPVGATLGIAADMADIIGQVDDDTAASVGMACAIAVAQNVSSKTYLSGITQAFDVFGSLSPDTEGEYPRATKWAERMAGSAIPAIVAKAERVWHPEFSDTAGFLEKFKSRIPGLSEDLPPMTNIFAEPISAAPGQNTDNMDGAMGFAKSVARFVNPIYVSKIKNDFVADEIAQQRTQVRMPPRVIAPNVKLNPREYHEYVRYVAGVDKKSGQKQTLKQALKELFKTNDYKMATDGPDGTKSDLIKMVYTQYKKQGKATFLRDRSSIRRRVEESQNEKIKKKRGY